MDNAKKDLTKLTVTPLKVELIAKDKGIDAIAM